MRTLRWLRAAAYAVSASGIALAVLIAIVVWLGVEGDRAPVHWNGAMEPDGYGSVTLAAVLPVLMVAVPIASMAPIAGVTRPRQDKASLLFCWVFFTGFLTALMLATAGQTASGTEIGQSSWITEVVVVTALASALLGGLAGYAVAGRAPAPPRARVLPPAEPPYWFAAKRYGYGWGRPLTWQGWGVLVGYLIAVLTPAANGHSELGLIVVLVGTPLLLLACVRHGEPPSWRWGNGGK